MNSPEAIAFLLFSSGVANAAEFPADFAYRWHATRVAIEAAGLFWIGAELAILAVVMAARRHVEQPELPERFSLRPGCNHLAAGIAFAVLAAACLGRHIWITPLPDLIGVAPVDGLESAYLFRAHVHLALWSAFIAVWVILECAIVYQGVRAYAALSRRLRPLRDA